MYKNTSKTKAPANLRHEVTINLNIAVYVYMLGGGYNEKKTK